MANPPPTGTPGQYGYDWEGNLITDPTPIQRTLAHILGALQKLVSFGGGGGGGGGSPSPITQAASIKVPASTTQAIPIGAREWTITILTGTATFNGAAGLPAGFSDSGEAALVAEISITTDATSTAYVRWGT